MGAVYSMKITPIYKNKIISLPYEAVYDKLSTASAEELKVLLAVFSADEFEPSVLASQLDITENALRRALEVWEKAGVICIDGQSSLHKSQKNSDTKKSEETEKKGRAIEIHTTLPQYTSAEIASVVEKTKGCSELLDSCQQILGKIFNAMDTSIIIGLIDHLSLSNEYILLLCSHAASIPKKSVRYIEKMAIDFFDRDIVTYAALEHELTRIENNRSLEFFVRDLFGIGKRALIKKEREFISSWSEKLGFSRDMIKAAYEVTISKTGDPSLNYANAVLENWYAAGLKTPDDVAKNESERQKSTENHPNDTSFSTNDFYEAALMRSYESSPNK